MEGPESPKEKTAESDLIHVDEIVELGKAQPVLMLKSISSRYRYRIGDFRKREGENSYRRLAKKIVEQYARGKLDATSYVFPEAAFQIIRSKMNKK